MGRTGTLITIDVELQRAMKEGVIDPFSCVTKLREQRNFMVQTEVLHEFTRTVISASMQSSVPFFQYEHL